LESAQARLSLIERCEWYRDPVGRVRQHQQQVDEAASRLQLTTSRAIAERRHRLHALEMRLVRLRPEAILVRRRELLVKTEHRLVWALGRRHLEAERRLRRQSDRLAAASPGRRIERETMRLEHLDARLRQGTSRVFADRRRSINEIEARLAASSHHQILNRGFSITRLETSGKLVGDPADVRLGDRISTETAHGHISSRVVDAKQGELFT
jgi:exonuclease VII large subunit